MPGTRRRLSADVRREQILEAATALFIERGFESVKMADIAEELGTSRPNIYTYYPSTEAILDVVLERHTVAYLEELKGMLEERPGLGADAVLNLLLKHRDLLMLLNCGGGPSFQKHRNELRKLFESTTRAYLPTEFVTADFESKFATPLVLQRNLLLSAAYELAMSSEEHDAKELGDLIQHMLVQAYTVIAPDLHSKWQELHR